MESLRWKKMACPNCGKRAFDVSEAPENTVMKLKCPNCHKLVTVPCTKDFLLQARAWGGDAEETHMPEKG